MIDQKKETVMPDQISEDVKITETLSPMGSPIIYIESSKFKVTFVISKESKNTSFFVVSTTSGKKPPINGFFTSIRDAKKEVLKYIKNSTPSKAVERDRKYKQRERDRGTGLSEELTS